MEIIRSFKDAVFSLESLLIIITTLSAVFLISRILGIPIKTPIKNLVDSSTRAVIKRNNVRTNRRNQLENIKPTGNKLVRKYRLLASNITNSMDFKLSIENFNTLMALMSVVAFVSLLLIFEDIFLALVSVFPVLMAIIVTFLMVTKRKIRTRDNAVMDALDYLCPMIEGGVTNTIKKNIDRIDIRIRVHFKNFLRNYEEMNKDFNTCMDILEYNLGPKFTQFANKAKLFEFNEKIGMHKQFMDIVETNKLNRRLNYKKDILFEETTKEMLMSMAVITAFLLFMYNNDLTGTLMHESILGSIVTALSVNIMMIIYILIQFIQLDIDFSEIDKESRSRKYQ